MVKRTSLVLTGVGIGAALWKSRSGAQTGVDAGSLKTSVNGLEARLAALETTRHDAGDAPSHSAETLTAIASVEATVASLSARFDTRFTDLEARVSSHEAKLKELPTLAQVVTTVEEMLSSTMSGLDRKLAEQVQSIEVLKTTVAQSDELMERVLDSIYSLQSHMGESDKSEVPVSV